MSAAAAADREGGEAGPGSDTVLPLMPMGSATGGSRRPGRGTHEERKESMRVMARCGHCAARARRGVIRGARFAA